MAERKFAIISPAVLKWARLSAHLSVDIAARKIGVKAARLESWENGKARPTIPQLRSCAKVYKRPLAVFFLSEPPTDFQPLRDFRSVPGGISQEYSYYLTLAIRDAHQKRLEAINLSEELEEPIVPFDISIATDDEPRSAAAKIRERLGVSAVVQNSWSGVYEALASWRSAIEKCGVLVMQMSKVAVSEARGFSIYSRVLPVISVNSKDAPVARIFTLMHELTHLAIHAAGTCDLLGNGQATTETERIEAFCNRVAANVLLPEESFVEDVNRARKIKRSTMWTDIELQGLAHRWSVSEEVVLRRLLALGLTTKTFYQQKRNEFVRQYAALAQVKRSGFMPVYKQPIARFGMPFVRLALDAYDIERITGSELSSILGMKLDHLPQLKSEVEQRG